MIRLTLAVLLLAVPAAAQVTALPPEAQAAIRQVGTAMNAEAVAATAAPLAGLQPPAAVAVLRDQSYGPDPRNRLDVFPASGTARPVVLFVHGGGFVGGDKTRPGAFFYDNVGQWAARSGFVGVTMTYRLAPQHPWPAGQEDVARAVGWVRANIAAHGGDPDRIILMGHSAGGAHVADYLAAQAAAPGVAAAVLVSGLYDVASSPASPTTRAYYGGDDGALAARSALPGLARLRIPVLLVNAEFDPAPFRAQGALLRAARADGQAFLDLPGHNHFSTIFAIGTPDRALGDGILALGR